MQFPWLQPYLKLKQASPASLESTDMSNTLKTGAQRLAEWLTAQANGDWEHSYGIKIETSDNPGWLVKIDIEETASQNMTGAGKRDGLSWQVVEGQLWGYDEETGNLEGLLCLMADLLESTPPHPNPSEA